MNASVSLGFVTWRTPPAVLARFLDSLAQAVNRLVENGAGQVAVYAVSNDDAQGAAEVAAALAPHRGGASQAGWEFIHGHGNIGYGAAQNLAIQRTQADCHFISNPDVVMAPDALLQAAKFLQAHPKTVAVGPQGYDADGQYAQLAKRTPTVLALLLRALSVPASPGFFGRRLGAYVYSDKLPAACSQPVDLLRRLLLGLPHCRPQGRRRFRPRATFFTLRTSTSAGRLAARGEIRELPTVRIRHYGGRTARRGPEARLALHPFGVAFFFPLRLAFAVTGTVSNGAWREL